MAPISLSREDTGKEPAAGLCVSAQGLAQGRSSPCPHPQHHSTSPATQHPCHSASSDAPEEPDTPGCCAAGQPSQRLLRSLSTLPQGKILDPLRFTTFYIYFALVLCALILSCFKDKPPLFSTENIDPVSLPAVRGGRASQVVPQPPPLSPTVGNTTSTACGQAESTDGLPAAPGC